MKSENETYSVDFVLLGFLSRTSVHMFPMALILLAFIAVLSGNALLILLIQVDSSLHTPMYFFLRQLAFMDICQTLIIVPKMLADFLIPGNPISPAGCGAQIFLVLTMGVSECLLLAVMAYDRYIAICNPLQYPILMSRNICFLLSAGVWMGASVNALFHTVFTLALPYCGSKEIDHFFCEVPALLKLSCSNTSRYEALVFVSSVVVLPIPSSLILATYACILSRVLRMKSTKGQQKALATCSSHLTVVVVFYGAGIFMYLRPSSYHSPEQDKIVSLFYTIVPPVLNPLIYSLRNRDVLHALRKWIGKCRDFQQD
ncbi:olfactory receptor 2T27 [Alligator mississippiensis]|uniref:Olfactory receptor n=1 Tax=Alligator mississippiensis TaxID=8496 RepID=A0A151NL12_ALLMI|nr:olfactory receptor 2T27 [Alligator mississippiensis]KYO37484.1 olfactory receptor 2T27-like [Alligator mississippiensis]